MVESSVNYIQVKYLGFFITAVEVLFYAVYVIFVFFRSWRESGGVSYLQSTSLNLLTFCFFLFSIISYVVYLYFGTMVYPGFMKYAAGIGLFLNLCYFIGRGLRGRYHVADAPIRSPWRYFFGSDDRYFMMYSLLFFHMTLIAQLFFFDPLLVGEFLLNQNHGGNIIEESYAILVLATIPFYFIYAFIFEEIASHRIIAPDPGKQFSENKARNRKNRSDSETERDDGFKFRPHRYMPNPEHPWDGGAGTSDYSGETGSNGSTGYGSGYEYGGETCKKSQNISDDLRDAYSVLCVSPDAPTAAVHRSFRDLVAKYNLELENIGRDSSLTAMRREIQCRKMLQLVQNAWKTVATARKIETFD